MNYLSKELIIKKKKINLNDNNLLEEFSTAMAEQFVQTNLNFERFNLVFRVEFLSTTFIFPYQYSHRTTMRHLKLLNNSESIIKLIYIRCLFPRGMLFCFLCSQQRLHFQETHSWNLRSDEYHHLNSTNIQHLLSAYKRHIMNIH